jgi:hypothetical protein
MKTFASVTDHRAWSLDAREQSKYFLEQVEGSSWERVGFIQLMIIYLTGIEYD